MALAFAPEYMGPANSEDTRPWLFQLPILRLLHSGTTAVSFFFLLSGYVCSAKPLRLARAEKVEEARSSIGSSVLRRVVRLVVPATCATIISFILAQLNAYQMAHDIHQEFEWLATCSPLHIPGFWAPLRSLYLNLVCYSTEKS